MLLWSPVGGEATKESPHMQHHLLLEQLLLHSPDHSKWEVKNKTPNIFPSFCVRSCFDSFSVIFINLSLAYSIWRRIGNLAAICFIFERPSVIFHLKENTFLFKVFKSMKPKEHNQTTIQKNTRNGLSLIYCNAHPDEI